MFREKEMSLHSATLNRTPGAGTAHDGGVATILLVEDENSVSRLVTRFLEWNGFRVLAATSGSEALVVWEQHRNDIDLLFTDVVLPDGPGARDLAGRFTAEQPGLKVIYTSGYALDFSVEMGMDLTEVNFVHKPYRPEQLLAVIRNALASRPQTPTVC